MEKSNERFVTWSDAVAVVSRPGRRSTGGAGAAVVPPRARSIPGRSRVGLAVVGDGPRDRHAVPTAGRPSRGAVGGGAAVPPATGRARALTEQHRVSDAPRRSRRRRRANELGWLLWVVLFAAKVARGLRRRRWRRYLEHVIRPRAAFVIQCAWRRWRQRQRLRRHHAMRTISCFLTPKLAVLRQAHLVGAELLQRLGRGMLARRHHLAAPRATRQRAVVRRVLAGAVRRFRARRRREERDLRLLERKLVVEEAVNRALRVLRKERLEWLNMTQLLRAKLPRKSQITASEPAAAAAAGRVPPSLLESGASARQFVLELFTPTGGSVGDRPRAALWAAAGGGGGGEVLGADSTVAVTDSVSYDETVSSRQLPTPSRRVSLGPAAAGVDTSLSLLESFVSEFDSNLLLHSQPTCPGPGYGSRNNYGYTIPFGEAEALLAAAAAVAATAEAASTEGLATRSAIASSHRGCEDASPQALVAAFHELLACTEALERRTLQNQLLDKQSELFGQMQWFLTAVEVARRVPPLFAPLVTSLKPVHILQKAERLFAEERSARSRLVEAYEAVPLSLLYRPTLSHTAEMRRLQREEDVHQARAERLQRRGQPAEGRRLGQSHGSLGETRPPGRPARLGSAVAGDLPRTLSQLNPQGHSHHLQQQQHKQRRPENTSTGSGVTWIPGGDPAAAAMLRQAASSRSASRPLPTNSNASASSASIASARALAHRLGASSSLYRGNGTARRGTILNIANATVLAAIAGSLTGSMTGTMMDSMASIPSYSVAGGAPPVVNGSGVARHMLYGKDTWERWDGACGGPHFVRAQRHPGGMGLALLRPSPGASGGGSTRDTTAAAAAGSVVDGPELPSGGGGSGCGNGGGGGGGGMFRVVRLPDGPAGTMGASGSGALATQTRLSSLMSSGVVGWAPSRGAEDGADEWAETAPPATARVRVSDAAVAAPQHQHHASERRSPGAEGRGAVSALAAMLTLASPAAGGDPNAGGAAAVCASAHGSTVLSSHRSGSSGAEDDSGAHNHHGHHINHHLHSGGGGGGSSSYSSYRPSRRQREGTEDSARHSVQQHSTTSSSMQTSDLQYTSSYIYFGKYVPAVVRRSGMGSAEQLSLTSSIHGSMASYASGAFQRRGGPSAPELLPPHVASELSASAAAGELVSARGQANSLAAPLPIALGAASRVYPSSFTAGKKHGVTFGAGSTPTTFTPSSIRRAVSVTALSTPSLGHALGPHGAAAAAGAASGSAASSGSPSMSIAGATFTAHASGLLGFTSSAATANASLRAPPAVAQTLLLMETEAAEASLVAAEDPVRADTGADYVQFSPSWLVDLGPHRSP